MWHDLFVSGIPFTEKVLRTVAVYAGLAILLRLAGKRDLAQLNTFDLVVMLLLSNIVQNAVIGPDNSLLGGLLGAAVLVALNALVVRAAASSDRLHRLFEGSPTVLVRDGRCDERAMRREGLRKADVVSALRRQGAAGLEEVEELVLAPGGTMLTRLKPESTDATRSDIAALAARLRRIEEKLDAAIAGEEPS